MRQAAANRPIEMLANLPVVKFPRQREWRLWLEKNHASSSGVWLRIGKKSSDVPTVTYAEALDAALCYGWIDGQKRGDSEQAWLQKFTPRGKRSIWSKINREKALGLIASGQMQVAGQREIDRAKKDGRWEAAYDSARTAEMPVDFQAALEKNAEASEFFQTLNAANRYAILFRIQTVKKAETRTRKIQQLVEMLEQRKKIHP